MAARVQSNTSESAADYLPRTISLPKLTEAARRCHGCNLYCHATQTVFGEGPASAKMMLIGEQPGDQEDRQGRPFVGPAGRLLDECLELAGIARDQVYVTNAVKHFKWEPRGKRRIHSKPSAGEVVACKPWLLAEISVVKPLTIVCLGATASQSLLGFDFRLTKHRGESQESEYASHVLATVHPSSLLRIPDREDQKAAKKDFIADLKKAFRQSNQ